MSFCMSTINFYAHVYIHVPICMPVNMFSYFYLYRMQKIFWEEKKKKDEAWFIRHHRYVCTWAIMTFYGSV